MRYEIMRTIAAILALCCYNFSYAEEIVLKNGSVLRGKIVAVDANTISVSTKAGSVILSKSDLASSSVAHRKAHPLVTGKVASTALHERRLAEEYVSLKLRFHDVILEWKALKLKRDYLRLDVYKHVNAERRDMERRMFEIEKSLRGKSVKIDTKRWEKAFESKKADIQKRIQDLDTRIKMARKGAASKYTIRTLPVMRKMKGHAERELREIKDELREVQSGVLTN